jgi:hypothetical protein
MKRGEIYLGVAGDLTLLSPYGRTLNIVNNEISRQDRTANGALRKDIIAVKKKITLDYSAIDGADLDIFQDLYDLESELILQIAKDTSAYDQYTVLMSPLDYTRILCQDNGLYSGVTVVLDEV